MAKLLGKEKDYLTRGPEFRPRQNFPCITEGTPMHSTWHVMHDPQGLIKLLMGKEFTVIAENNSSGNIYIQSASLNGEPLNQPWIDQSAIKNGSTLTLQMGNRPNKTWGNNP